MNRAALIAVLRDRLGNRPDLDNRAAYELDLAQEHLEMNWPDAVIPWFLEKQVIIAWEVGNNEIGLPDDFIRPVDGAQIQTLEATYTQDQGFYTDPDFLTSDGHGAWTFSDSDVRIYGSNVVFDSAEDGDYARGLLSSLKEGTTYVLEIKDVVLTPFTGTASLLISAWGTLLDTVVVGLSSDLRYSFTTSLGLPAEPWVELKYQDDGAQGEVSVGWVQVYDPTSQVLDSYERTGVLRDRKTPQFQEAFRAGDLGDDGSEYYSIFGGKLQLTFSPAEEGAILLRYYAKQSLMAEDTDENEWAKFTPELLIATAGEKLARYIHDPELSGLFKQDRMEAMGAAIAASWERQYADVDMVVREAES